MLFFLCIFSLVLFVEQIVHFLDFFLSLFYSDVVLTFTVL